MDRHDAAFIVLVLALMFLFWGDPDVFDALIDATRNWLLK